MQRCKGCMKEFGKEYEVCPHCGRVVGEDPETMTGKPDGARSSKPSGTGPNKKKLLIAAAVAVVALVAVAVGIRIASDKPAVKEPVSDEVQSTAQVEITQVYGVPEQVIEDAIAAYEEELSESDDYFSAYVVDINKDGISEIICRPGEMGSQFALTYTEKNGLSRIELMGHSSMTPEVYISEENCFYIRDDGHNQGTAFYHHAEVYEINENGFEKIGEIDGDEPEEFDWEDEDLFEEMDAKYDALFEEKIKDAVGDKDFKAYTEVANTDDPIQYVNSQLSLSLSDKGLIRRLYENYIDSEASQSRYFKPAEEEDYEMYDGAENNGERKLRFIDLDADGVEECFLTVPFANETGLGYDYVYIFDIDENEKIKEVFASDICANHRTAQKVAIVEEDGSYLIHSYYSDPHALWGSVYSYDGESLALVWSYDSSNYQGTPREECVFVVSTEYDMMHYLNSASSNKVYYLDEYNDTGKLPDDKASVVYGEDFFAIYEGYLDAAVYRVPMNETEYRVTNPSGITVRADAGADSEKYDLWDIFKNSEYYSRTLETYTETQDFNKDGSDEMFVLQFGDDYDGSDPAYIYSAKVYYVTRNGVKVVEEDITATPGGQTEAHYIGGRWFFSFISRFSGGHDEYLYTASGENAINVTPGGGGLEKIADNEISLYFVDYNQIVGGGGRTNITYYFYWDENSMTFKEYGATHVSEKEFLRCKGAADILEKIEKSGFTVNDILYRQNGIIVINCDNGEIYSHYTYRLSENNELTLIEGTGDNGEEFGICYSAAKDGIAVYPDELPF